MWPRTYCLHPPIFTVFWVNKSPPGHGALWRGEHKLYVQMKTCNFLSSSECFTENRKLCLSMARADIFICFHRSWWLHFSVTVKMEMSADFSNDHRSWKGRFRVQTPSCSLKETHDVVPRQCNSRRQSLDVTEHHGWFKYKPRHFTAGKSSC